MTDTPNTERVRQALKANHYFTDVVEVSGDIYAVHTLTKQAFKIEIDTGGRTLSVEELRETREGAENEAFTLEAFIWHLLEQPQTDDN